MVFKFEPIYLERPWGGISFKSILGRPVPANSKVGEAWEIVDRKHCESMLTTSSPGDASLRNLIESNPHELMGPGWNPMRRFPILVKWLDCAARLSLQVHPPESIAEELGGEAKTENWYVAHACPGAVLWVGLKKGVDKQTLLEAIEKGSVEILCNRIESKAGDSILVKSGEIHAIDAGNLILEIQQNSDSTYRIFDWGRMGLDGKPRQLHLEKSLRCINFQSSEPQVLSSPENPERVLADCSHFRIRKFIGYKSQVIPLKKKNEQCMVLTALNGSLELGDDTLENGRSCLSPYSQACEVRLMNDGEFLVTDRFYLPN